jgi:hypothetical protein
MQRGKLEPKQQYLARRLAQEEQAAGTAASPVVRNVHLEMARRLKEMVDSDSQNSPAANGME